MTAAGRAVAIPGEARLRNWLSLLALIIGATLLQLLFRSFERFPPFLDTFFEAPIDTAGNWMRANRRTHWLFTGFFTPLSGTIDAVITAFESALLWLPWFALIALVFYVPFRVRMWRQGLVAAAVLTYTGLIGLWNETIETLALMSATVLLAALIGIPLGTWAAMRPRVEAILRPFLDAMQTIPAFVYFLPLFILLGVGNVPGLAATLIYALPPVVRLTTLGIKQVPAQAVEASRMYGSSTRQTLFKVQLPMALSSILTGLSQTIMMALGIVVLATLISAGGLGGPVLQTLQQRRTGRGIAAGLAIVAVAMVLDRVWRALAVTDPSRRVKRRQSRIVLAVIAGGAIAGRLIGAGRFPEVWDWTLFDPIDRIVTWARDNLRFVTRPFNDFIVANVYLPLRDGLTEAVAWPVIVFVAGWIAWRVKGWGLAAFTMVSIVVIGALGRSTSPTVDKDMWALSIDTLVQVLIATVLTVAVAIPLGIVIGRRPRLEAIAGPFLDALQTIPSLVYIIPAVILFTVGVVPGIIATVLYAMVPGVRITALAMREVPEESIEASRTYGATPRQTMYGVRIPLAAPTIMAAINQVIMMVLAMVIITGLVGGGALGFETVRSLTRSLFGWGIEVGLVLALMAMILDRITEAIGQKLQPPANPA